MPSSGWRRHGAGVGTWRRPWIAERGARQCGESIKVVEQDPPTDSGAVWILGVHHCDEFGQSIINGNDILAELNPQMPQIRYDTQRLADGYAAAAPDLFDALNSALTTAHTLNEQKRNVDVALMASVGFGNTGAGIFRRGAPYLVRGTQDLIPTSLLLDEYSPEIFCTIRNYHDVAPKAADALGGNGYSLRLKDEVLPGEGNPWVYPDNLPRVNAHDGPEGRPGCWQEVTKDLWPAPYLVMDIGASIAPYNHIGLSSPFAIDYVWAARSGRTRSTRRRWLPRVRATVWIRPAASVIARSKPMIGGGSPPDGPGGRPRCCHVTKPSKDDWLNSVCER